MTGGVVVDYILVGVQGAPDLQDEPARTPEQARLFAASLVAQLDAGADWWALKRAHNEGPAPATQVMYDLGLGMSLGEYGIARYDAELSSNGVSVVRRVG